MIVLLIFLLPLLGGLIAFFLKEDRVVRSWSLLVSLAVLILTLVGNYFLKSSDALQFSASWMGSLGSSFSLRLDGLSQLLCLLTAVAYPIIFIGTWKTEYKRPNNFFALMLLTQAGLMGVFTATDALLFYFFWELALVPVYFLCSGWGGERRIAVTFKFFIYTFTGSVLMLVGLLYLYFQTPDHSFSLQSFYALKSHLSNDTQSWLFWVLFIAFAIKMPVFPFHTWQPDTYEQSPAAATMVLSGIMVKMGLFGLIRWVWPILPMGVHLWGDVVMSMAVIGVIYASIIAIQQDDLKRLIAYSSIAHMGLMVMAVFSENQIGMQGVMMQMFNHGINIIGLWVVVELIERQFGTRKMSQLGGIAQKAPALTALLVIVALANVALPLTNSFVGEFLIFNGIWNSLSVYRIVFAAVAGVSIILAAVYTLNMIQKVFFGNTTPVTEATHDIRLSERLVLALLVVLIISFGVYPQPLLDLTNGFVDTLMKQVNVKAFI